MWEWGEEVCRNLGIEAPKIWNQGIEAQQNLESGNGGPTKSGIWDMATPDSSPHL